MFAFIKIGTYTAKAYDQDGDWQVISNENTERWASKWVNGINASCENALRIVVETDGKVFNKNNVVFC